MIREIELFQSPSVTRITALNTGENTIA